MTYGWGLNDERSSIDDVAYVLGGQDLVCFTDGCVDYPTTAWASIPGVGVWWPSPPDVRGSDTPCTGETDQDSTNYHRCYSELLLSKTNNF